MKVIQFPLDKINYVNVFLAFDESSNEAFLVDCGAFPEEIRTYIKDQNLTLKFLLVTHSHYDHIDGIDDFKKYYQVPIYAASNLYDHKVSEGDRIPFGKNHITVYETPGHIEDGVSFFIQNVVFVGDAIFAGAVGGTAGRAQFEEEIQHVKNKIFTLPDNTIIYSGHGAPSVVGVERTYNPFFN